jgi:tRNA(His) 5'-end guanylyltransferase
MNRDAFEQRMRALECFHQLRLLPGAWVVVRVDGRGFTRFTAPRFDKPFDPAFHKLMVQTARVLLEALQGCYAYTESDEVSILCLPEWELFDRKLEKVVSLSAGIASSALTQACGVAVQFDSRVWLGARESQVVDYFRWRQADATRCALHGWCYWTLRRAGKSAKAATAALQSAAVADMNEMLFQHGINFNTLPTWQRRGTGLYWETYTKTGRNPHTQQTMVTSRRRIKVDRDLPMQDAYSQFIRDILRRGQSRSKSNHITFVHFSG